MDDTEMSIEFIYKGILNNINILKTNSEYVLLNKIKQCIEDCDYKSEDEVSCIIKDISNYIQTDAKNIIKGRRPPFPERISENIAKILLCKAGENVFKGKSGDLITDTGYKFEVKCFSSSGPISFGPTCTWNELIFVDLIDYKNYNVKVYRTRLTNESLEWNDINISKTQTFRDQKIMKRRPRIGFSTLHPQIKDYTTLLYSGNIQGIDK